MIELDQKLLSFNMPFLAFLRELDLNTVVLLYSTATQTSKILYYTNAQHVYVYVRIIF